MTYTPGPWNIDATASGEDIVFGADGSVVAQAIGKNFPDDAKLIAAAPDLLTALWSAESAVQELCHDQHPDNQCWVVLTEIRAALSKATT